MAVLFLGGLFGAAGSAAGAYISAKAMAKEAKKNRKWQERMSNTTYVRTMADMGNAGLNPILAYKQGGSPVGPGATAQVPNLGDALSQGLSSGAGAAEKGSQVKLNRQLKATSSALELVHKAEEKRKGQEYKTGRALEGLHFSNQDAATASAGESMARTRLMQAEMPRAEAIADFDRTDAGKRLNVGSAGAERVGGGIGALMQGFMGRRRRR